MQDPNNYNPNLNRNSRPLDFRDSTNSWIIAAILAVAGIVGILLFNHHAKEAMQSASPSADAGVQMTAPVTQGVSGQP